MGGFFGIASKEDSMMDVFFGVDYHTHLGTRRAGLAAYDKEIGEKYYDLFWKMNSGDEKADAEFTALSKSIPADEHYWLRRNT